MSATYDHLLATLQAAIDETTVELHRLHAARTALLGGEPVPIVRPPAPDVAPPPVEMPKVPAEPKRAVAGGQRRYDPAEVATVASAAQRAGVHVGRTVAEHFGISTGAGSRLVIETRKAGHDIAYLRTPRSKPRAEPKPSPVVHDPAPFTSEPIERVPFDPDKAREAAADGIAGRPIVGAKAQSEIPRYRPSAPAPLAPVGTWTPELAREAIEAMGAAR